MLRPLVTTVTTARPPFHGHLVWVNGYGWAEQIGFTIYLT